MTYLPAYFGLACTTLGIALGYRQARHHRNEK